MADEYSFPVMLRDLAAEMRSAALGAAYAMDVAATQSAAHSRDVAELVAALEPFANIGISSNPDYRPEIRLPREAIIEARRLRDKHKGGA